MVVSDHTPQAVWALCLGVVRDYCNWLIRNLICNANWPTGFSTSEHAGSWPSDRLGSWIASVVPQGMTRPNEQCPVADQILQTISLDLSRQPTECLHKTPPTQSQPQLRGSHHLKIPTRPCTVPTLHKTAAPSCDKSSFSFPRTHGHHHQRASPPTITTSLAATHVDQYSTAVSVCNEPVWPGHKESTWEPHVSQDYDYHHPPPPISKTTTTTIHPLLNLRLVTEHLFAGRSLEGNRGQRDGRRNQA